MVDFLNNFKTKQKINFKDGFQNWWTDFVFHYNDLNNIVSILNSAKLYSRNRAIKLGLLQNDIADDSVISNTHIKVYDYARFYFGAKTPTAYNNEGLIPKASVSNNAHCPVPIFLLFDFTAILSLNNVIFSNGNMGASSPEIYNNINDLQKLEWNNIYHRNSLYGYSDEEKRHIVYCRNAEVLVKNDVNIYDSLKWICVRSNADKETLLNLVDSNTKIKIKDKIKVFTNDGLFHNHKFYLNEISLKNGCIEILFINKNNQLFDIEVIAISIATNQQINHSKNNYNITTDLNFKLNELDISQGIHFILKIDSHTIYDNIIYYNNEVLI
jgi:hypothetical protein